MQLEVTLPIICVSVLFTSAVYVFFNFSPKFIHFLFPCSYLPLYLQADETFLDGLNLSDYLGMYKIYMLKLSVSKQVL